MPSPSVSDREFRMRFSTWFLTLLMTVTLRLCVCCSITDSLCKVSAPGDINIAILGSVHFGIKNAQPWILPDLSACMMFDFITFVQTLAAIHTIETINDSGFLPGIKLGYQMCDPCSYAAKSLLCVTHMLNVNGSLPIISDFSSFNSPVKVFLGDRYTETSIPAAKLLGLYRIPQIGCSASAAALSDKFRYTSFFRVIPSNIYQTQALAKLLRHFKWNWIGMVTLDDEYGKGFYENFLPQAEEQGACLAFHEVVSHYQNVEERIKEVADRIRANSSVKAVLLILRVQQVEMLFQEMIKTNTSRIWIGSNTWSVASQIMNMKGINELGDILGISLIIGEVPGLADYLQNLTIGPGVRNDFIREYKQMRFNCSSGQQSEYVSPSACNVTDPQEANDDYLLHAVELRSAYNQRVAVYAIAHAIKELLQCNDTCCPGDTDFMPYKLLDVLREVNFTLDNHTYYFNENGDFETGYDIMMWKKNGDVRMSEVVGKFFVKNRELEIYEQNIPWANDKVPLSRCSDPCPPGMEKKMANNSCCYSCSYCSEGYYSNEMDQPNCKKCSEGYSSLPGSSECQKLDIWCLKWSSCYSIVVLVGASVGFTLLLFSLILFTRHRTNPILQEFFAISCLMKLGLMVSFGSVILFLGSPNIHLCRAQQTMYGLGFTLCVSCILGKTTHIFLEAKSSNPAKQHKLKKLDKPFALVIVLTSGQVLICIFWLIFDPLNVEETPSKTHPLTVNHVCKQGSMHGFGAMHMYIALLALVCFVLAFKGRDDETEPIVFSMLIHLFSWLCFIPIFITQDEARPIVQVSAIMVSNYGVIFCHFAPKWYKIFSEMADNSEVANHPEDPLGDADSGVITEAVSIDRMSQSQFSLAESESSDWDINSLSLSESHCC